jgi:hypothetical protein
MIWTKLLLRADRLACLDRPGGPASEQRDGEFPKAGVRIALATLVDQSGDGVIGVEVARMSDSANGQEERPARGRGFTRSPVDHPV